MSGQIRRDHAKMLREQRRKIAPRMGRAARAMKQQEVGTLPHDLNVPVQTARLDEAARLAIRPIRAVAGEIETFPFHAHGRALTILQRPARPR